MYSNELKKLSVYNDLKTEDGEVRRGVEIGRKTIEGYIDGFCKKEDVIGVKPTEIFKLFDEYCKKEGLPLINYIILGSCFIRHFGLVKKRVRVGKNLYTVYVDDLK